MKEFYTSLNESTLVLLSLSIILFAGFLLTRLTKRLHLPNVSGYILAGVLIGPQVASLVPAHILSHMGFISDVALAFIAFGVGKFFKKEVLMKTGWKVVIVTLWESVLAGILITLSMRFLFHLSWDFCLILGAIAPATAPASTMMTIRQYRAKGDFVNILLQGVALDDVVCLLIFSVVVAVINAGRSGHVRAGDVLLPIFYNIAALGIGFLCGYLLSRLITPTRSKDNRLILAIAMLMEPPVLLADEPTSALDVAVQRQVVQEMLALRELFGTAIILVTHDIGVVSAVADTDLVLKEGRIMEYAETAAVLQNPQNEYTRKLLSAVPRLRRS